MKRWHTLTIGLALALTLALTAPGCVGTVIAPAVHSKAPRPTPAADSPTGPLRAGVRTIDITPAPGFSILGHGPEGRVSTGTLLRLRCQPFVFRQAYGEREEVLAIVPCDLGWSSLVLSRRVAEMLRDKGVPIGADRLVLSATHTHGGPAHYLGSANYNGLLSSEKPGYSQDLVDFLATRIAGAIKDAYDDAGATDVCARWKKWSFHDPDRTAEEREALDRGTSGISTRIGKNRSMEAFSRNTLTAEEQERFLDPVMATNPAAARPALYAVDGTISVLRVDRCNAGEPRAPLGVLAVVGVHPTGISNQNELYHGDLFGYASREVEALIAEEIGPGAGRTIVGIINGVEGDVAPVVDFQGPRETRRLGGVIGRQIHHLWNEAAPPVAPTSPSLRVAYRELELRGARVTATNAFHQALPAVGWAEPPPHATIGGDGALCDRARLGTAASGGTEDGKTFFQSLPDFREGATAPRSTSCHAPKLELVPPADGAFAFPTRVPIHAFEIAGELATTFPGEIATLAAFRGRRQLERYLQGVGGAGAARATHAARMEVIQLGLTGEYLQYMTTSDEYGVQEYEGASALYGPNEARFFAHQALCLARWLYQEVTPESDQACALDHGVGSERRPQPAVGEVDAVQFKPGGSFRRGNPGAGCASHSPGSFGRANDKTGRKRRIAKLLQAGCGEEIYAITRDGERGFGVTYRPASDCDGPALAPRVMVVDEAGNRLDDDDGDGMEIRYASRTWRVAWYPSSRVRAQLAHGPAFRFVVSSREGAPARSKAAGASCWNAIPSANHP